MDDDGNRPGDADGDEPLDLSALPDLDDLADSLVASDAEPIERAVLNDSEEGRRIQAEFIEHFGVFVREQLRPVLREVAHQGDQPQLLVNGLAELLRTVADSIEFPLHHPRAGFPPQIRLNQ